MRKARENLPLKLGHPGSDILAAAVPRRLARLARLLPAERCWSGRTGLPAKQFHPKRVTGVRIPPSPPTSLPAHFSKFSFETGLRRIDIRGQSLTKDQNSLQGSWQSAFEARDNFRIAHDGHTSPSRRSLQPRLSPPVWYSSALVLSVWPGPFAGSFERRLVWRRPSRSPALFRGRVFCAKKTLEET
jgi:hypothetical protein